MRPSYSLRNCAKLSVLELVMLARSGDQDAFTELYRRYRPLVLGIALNAGIRGEQARDLTQDVFVIVWRKLYTLRNPAAFKCWVGKIAGNTVKNSFRRRSPLCISQELLEAYDEGGDTASKIASFQELADEAKAVLAGLEPMDREALQLRELEGLRYDEIAKVMGCPLGTAKRRIHTARNRLRKAWSDSKSRQHP